MRKTDAEAFKLLGLKTDATPHNVRMCWRLLRSTLHPDRGGNVAEFDAMRKAYDLALAYASKCSECNATGKVLLVRGLKSVLVRCDVCGGTGSIS